jgi:hypothetical protein
MHKKFIIYGEFWRGTLPALLSEELTLRNYSVLIFDYTKILPGIRIRNIIGRIKRRLFLRFYELLINRAFLAMAIKEGPCVLVICKGIHLWPKTIRLLSDAGYKLINWNPDDFFNEKNSSGNLIESLKYYDAIVSSRPHLFNEYLYAGIKRCIFIDWYYVPHIHYPRKQINKYGITFVGSWSSLREEFISKVRYQVEVWGGGWENASAEFKLSNKIHMKIVSQDEMSLIFSSSKFNLNLITHENRDLSNLRFFEICASGGLLITERNTSSLSYLKDGIECLMYDSANDVNEILGCDIDFQAIANEGHRAIISAGNSFSTRVSEFLDKL